MIQSRLRTLRATTFNGANDSSHRQLFESATRVGKYLIFEKAT